jgi:hypothetical protein
MILSLLRWREGRTSGTVCMGETKLSEDGMNKETIAPPPSEAEVTSKRTPGGRMDQKAIGAVGRIMATAEGLASGIPSEAPRARVGAVAATMSLEPR